MVTHRDGHTDAVGDPTRAPDANTGYPGASVRQRTPTRDSREPRETLRPKRRLDDVSLLSDRHRGCSGGGPTQPARHATVRLLWPFGEEITMSARSSHSERGDEESNCEVRPVDRHPTSRQQRKPSRRSRPSTRGFRRPRSSPSMSTFHVPWPSPGVEPRVRSLMPAIVIALKSR